MAEDNPVAQSVGARLALDEVIEAARNLPEAQRRVIALRFGAGLSVAETAGALGKSGANVRAIQHKAVVKLREMLVGEGPEGHGEGLTGADGSHVQGPQRDRAPLRAGRRCLSDSEGRGHPARCLGGASTSDRDECPDKTPTPKGLEQAEGLP